MSRAEKRVVVRTGTTVDEMVRSIADLIITGDLTPGERLDEGSLASRYEVSRTPVREALRQLCAMGLVERPPNRRAVVTNVTGGFLLSMFEAMAELEGICARLSAERMTDGERGDLVASHRDSLALVQAGAEESYALYNVDFHSRLYRGAHNAHIADLVSQTRARLSPFRRAQFRLDGRLIRSWREHDAIVAAILNGDGATAARAAYEHVEIVGDASAAFARPDAGASPVGAPVT